MDTTQIVGRGPQVGLLLASAVVPTTFTRSLSERSWIDQGMITGLATGTHFLLTIVTQDTIDAAGTTLSHALPLPDSWSDEQRAATTTLMLDVAVIPVGFGLAAVIGHREHESVVRSAIRQVGWRFAWTGVGASLLATGPVGSDVAAIFVDVFSVPAPADQWVRVYLFAASTGTLNLEPVALANPGRNQEIVFSLL